MYNYRPRYLYTPVDTTGNGRTHKLLTTVASSCLEYKVYLEYVVVMRPVARVVYFVGNLADRLVGINDGESLIMSSACS